MNPIEIVKPLYLHNPTYFHLDDTYRSLPLLESVQVKSSNFEQAIQDLEKTGFIAIVIQNYSPEGRNQTIMAYKGKHGPCYFTGKKVGYRGAALAALDDDNHLLLRNELIEVCDKTYRVLGLDPYHGLVYGESDFQKYGQKMDSQHENESGFEASQVRLYEQLKKVKKHSGHENKVLFYPGPFRILIIEDGSMVYRGKCCSVPADQFKDLMEIDRCVASVDSQEGIKSWFQEEYETSGSACLMSNFNPEDSVQPDFETDFSKLKAISGKFKQRLVDVIDNQRKYFILIGNELDEELGCCPSEEVTEANLLVKYGILSSLAEPIQGDSCPVTMYAFKDELSVEKGGVFNSNINKDLRDKVRLILGKSPYSTMMNIMKWVLLVFIVISLGIAARKCESLQTATMDGSLYEQLNPTSEGQFLALLFHNKKRCYQCQQMEKYTLELIRATGNTDLEADGLEFKTVVIDDPENQKMVNMFSIFAPTIVLLEFDEKEVVRSKVSLKLSGLYRDERAFKAELSNEIHQFMTEDNE